MNQELKTTIDLSVSVNDFISAKIAFNESEIRRLHKENELLKKSLNMETAVFVSHSDDDITFSQSKWRPIITEFFKNNPDRSFKTDDVLNAINPPALLKHKLDYLKTFSSILFNLEKAGQLTKSKAEGKGNNYTIKKEQLLMSS